MKLVLLFTFYFIYIIQIDAQRTIGTLFEDQTLTGNEYRIDTLVKDGKIIITTWYDEKTKYSVQTFIGPLFLERKIWWRNGKLKSVDKFKRGKYIPCYKNDTQLIGYCQLYFDNPQFVDTINLKYPKKSKHTYKSWYANGQIEQKYYYKISHWLGYKEVDITWDTKGKRIRKMIGRNYDEKVKEYKN